ncbi:MAG: porphobilinogen synthase [Phycisphaerae bacterium]
MTRFPRERLRRRRNSEAVRDILTETRIAPEDLIYPLFVVENDEDAGPIQAMPGIRRFTREQVVDEAARVADDGVRGVLLFGIPASKSPNADDATRDDNVVASVLHRLRDADLPLLLMTDVCVCSYTTSGHCGIIMEHDIDNDRSLDVLASMAASHARAGADFVAPSAMMDGQVDAIRQRLDQEGFATTGILAYAAKFSSAFYGPFREAADSAPQFGDRRSYQMNPANQREAMAEIAADIEEGADMVMIKPGLPYLDVIALARREYPSIPMMAYQVSGEFSMIKAAAEKGWLDERRVIKESLLGLKRAGADAIITYFAGNVGDWLDEQV